MPAKPGIAFVEFETEMQVGGQRAPHYVLRFCRPAALHEAYQQPGHGGHVLDTDMQEESWLPVRVQLPCHSCYGTHVWVWLPPLRAACEVIAS